MGINTLVAFVALGLLYTGAMNLVCICSCKQNCKDTTRNTSYKCHAYKTRDNDTYRLNDVL